MQNITFAYTREEGAETVKAIDGVSFEIEPGSFTAIIGKNGSGKSTLAKNLNGLLLPTEGDILVADYNTKDDAHIWDVRQTAGMVFQNPDNQLVSAIVEDDVAFGPETWAWTRRKSASGWIRHWKRSIWGSSRTRRRIFCRADRSSGSPSQAWSQ